MGGNPGMRPRDPGTLAKLARSRRAVRVADLLPGLDEWLPVVRKLRPETPWPEAAEAVNAALPRGRHPFTKERLVRAVRLLVAEGLAEEGLLAPAPRQRTRRGALARSQAVEVAATLMTGRPGMTLAELGVELVRLRHLPPRGGPAWAPSSLTAVLDRAQAQGLLVPPG